MNVLQVIRTVVAVKNKVFFNFPSTFLTAEYQRCTWAGTVPTRCCGHSML